MSDFEHLEAESPVLAKRFSGMIQVRNTSGRTIIADSKGNYMTPDSHAAVNPFDLTVIKQLNKSILTNIEFSIDENDLTHCQQNNKSCKKQITDDSFRWGYSAREVLSDTLI